MFYSSHAMRSRSRRRPPQARSQEPQEYIGKGFIGDKIVERSIFARSLSEADSKAMGIFNTLKDIWVTPKAQTVS